MALENEKASLEKIINGLTAILGNEEILKSVMKKDLQDVKKEYDTPRITEIRNEITEIKIDTMAMIPKEDVVVMVTKDGYIKRTSFRSYTASNPEDITIKENDYILGIYEMNTTDTILLFTSAGNYLHIPVHTIPDLKWKDMPKHVSNLIELAQDETVVSALPAYNFDSNSNVIIATRNGMIKRSKLKDFKLQRYSKATSCIKLKDDDAVISAFIEKQNYLFLTTDSGYGLSFKTDEVPLVGVKAAGVKAIKLKDDNLISINNYDPSTDEYISVITDKSTGKRVRLSEFEISSRARRGLQVIREVKTNPYHIIKTFITDSKNYVGLKGEDITTIKLTELPISDRYSIGSQISKQKLIDAYLVAALVRSTKEQVNIQSSDNTNSIDNDNLNKQVDDNASEKFAFKESTPKRERVSLKEIDDRLMTIDDFLN